MSETETIDTTEAGGESAEAPPESTAAGTDETFTKEYVTSLRDEAASYRTSYKPWKEAASHYNDQEQEMWRQIMSSAAADPSEGAKILRELANTWDPNDPGAGSPPAAGDDDDYVTPAQVKAMLEQNQRNADAARAQAELKQEAQSLGYDPDSAEYAALIHEAYYNTDSDLKKAHETLESRKQKWIDDYVEGKKAEAQAGPKVSPTELARGLAAEQGDTPKDFASARAAMEKFLDAQAGQ